MNRPGIFWVMFNPSDIATAKQFMDSLKGDSTVDVLGITRAMETVSDILFPATSTLHKRIRYQIFVPAIILSIYRRKQRIKAEYELTRLSVSTTENADRLRRTIRCIRIEPRRGAEVLAFNDLLGIPE